MRFVSVVGVHVNEFSESTYIAYSKLRCGKGVQFFTCALNSYSLELLLSTANLSSPSMPKSLVGNVCIYICLIQRDLDLYLQRFIHDERARGHLSPLP